MHRTLTFIIIALLSSLGVTAQTTKEVYRKSLNETLDQVAARFGKTIRYGREVDGKTIEYASWKIGNQLETTLETLLYPFDLRFEKLSDDEYVVRSFRYHIRSVEEGKEHLDTLAALYNDLPSWENRRKEIRNNILKQTGLLPLPKKTPLNPVVKAKRSYKEYTVENVLIEVIPGVFLGGNLYKPAKVKGTVPAILCPHGHFTGGDLAKYDFTDWGRFRAEQQIRCAELARLGCVVFSYNMFAQGEMIYQISPSEHATPFALTMQTLSSIRALDFISTLKEVDIKRIGITGASGGGTQSFLLAAIDDRIALSVPAVMVSAHFFGGCACESGLPIHFPENGIRTCNPEIAALTAPRPQLLISDGNDWTANNPTIEYPYLQNRYALYGKTGNVELAHLPNDQHDYGVNKRLPMYQFIAKHFKLDLKRIQSKDGKINETGIVIEPYTKMLAIKSAEELPRNALRDVELIKKRIKTLQ